MQSILIETALRGDPITLTKEERAELLIKANILNANGDYVKRFFSAKTIRKDKVRRLGK